MLSGSRRSFASVQPYGTPGPVEAPDECALTVRLFQVLSELDPTEARFLQGSVPRADSTFGVGLAFFLAAASDGVRGWIGSRAARLVDGLDGGLLLDELDEALRPRRRHSADGRAWLVSRLPVAVDGDLRRMICAVAPRRDANGWRTYAVQMRLPILGAMQIVAKGGNGQLDLVLHTSTALPRACAVDLATTATAALTDVGLRGELTFAPLIGAWLDLDETLHADTRL